MKTTAYVFLGAVLVLLLIISFVAANDPTPDDIQSDRANQIADEKYYGGGGWGGPGGGWGGWGGRRGGGWGGWGGGRGWGGGSWGGGGRCGYWGC